MLTLASMSKKIKKFLALPPYMVACSKKKALKNLDSNILNSNRPNIQTTFAISLSDQVIKMERKEQVMAGLLDLTILLYLFHKGTDISNTF